MNNIFKHLSECIGPNNCEKEVLKSLISKIEWSTAWQVPTTSDNIRDKLRHYFTVTPSGSMSAAERLTWMEEACLTGKVDTNKKKILGKSLVRSEKIIGDHELYARTEKVAHIIVREGFYCMVRYHEW